jgi:hypothetical protein
VVLAMTLAAVSLPFAAAPASAATPYNVNLVRNPGAEEGPGGNGYTTVPVPGWTADQNFTVVRYGSPEFPTKAESSRIAGGKKFFSCGPDTDYIYARQVIGIRGRGARIDAGRVRARVQVRLAGYLGGPDAGDMTVVHLRADGEEIGNRAYVGMIDHGTSGRFLQKRKNYVLPVGTRALRIELYGVRGNDGGSYCDVYFDKISVVLEPIS